MNIFSYGGGVQSTAALVLAARGEIDYRIFLFANTGDDSEHPDTLRYVRDVAIPYAQAHGIELHELRRTRRGGQAAATLYEAVTEHPTEIAIPIRNGDGVPFRRGCTKHWKTVPIAQWTKARGVTPDQYVEDCVRPMARLMRPGDWFAFGGFCIIGRQRSLLPVFYETFPRVLDLLIPRGITRFHLLGVTVPDAVRFASQEAEARGVAVSTDGSAVEYASFVSGAEYVDGRQVRGRWSREDKYVNYCPVELGRKNIAAYSAWAYALGGNGEEPHLCAA